MHILRSALPYINMQEGKEVLDIFLKFEEKTIDRENFLYTMLITSHFMGLYKKS